MSGDDVVLAFRQAMARSADAVAVYDDQGKLMYANKAFTAMFAFQEAGPVGSVTDIVPEEGREQARDMRLQLGKGKAVNAQNVPRVNALGMEMTMGLSAIPVMDRRGEFRGHIEFLHDQTAEAREREALTTTLSRLMTVCSASPDPIIVHDAAGGISMVNHAFERVFGVSDLVMGQEFDFVPVQQTAVEEENLEKVRAGETVSYESTRKTSEGTERDFEVNAAPIMQDGEFTGWIHILRDITDRKAAEELRLEQNKLQGVLEMSVAAAHEFSQPLQSLTMDMGYLLERLKDFDEDTREALQSMSQAVGRLSDVIRKMQGITDYKSEVYSGDIRMIDLD